MTFRTLRLAVEALPQLASADKLIYSIGPIEDKCERRRDRFIRVVCNQILDIADILLPSLLKRHTVAFDKTVITLQYGQLTDGFSNLEPLRTRLFVLLELLDRFESDSPLADYESESYRGFKRRFLLFLSEFKNYVEKLHLDNSTTELIERICNRDVYDIAKLIESAAESMDAIIVDVKFTSEQIIEYQLPGFENEIDQLVEGICAGQVDSAQMNLLERHSNCIASPSHFVAMARNVTTITELVDMRIRESFFKQETESFLQILKISFDAQSNEEQNECLRGYFAYFGPSLNHQEQYKPFDAELNQTLGQLTAEMPHDTKERCRSTLLWLAFLKPKLIIMRLCSLAIDSPRLTNTVSSLLSGMKSLCECKLQQSGETLMDACLTRILNSKADKLAKPGAETAFCNFAARLARDVSSVACVMKCCSLQCLDAEVNATTLRNDIHSLGLRVACTVLGAALRGRKNRNRNVVSLSIPSEDDDRLSLPLLLTRMFDVEQRMLKYEQVDVATVAEIQDRIADLLQLFERHLRRTEKAQVSRVEHDWVLGNIGTTDFFENKKPGEDWLLGFRLRYHLRECYDESVPFEVPSALLKLAPVPGWRECKHDLADSSEDIGMHCIARLSLCCPDGVRELIYPLLRSSTQHLQPFSIKAASLLPKASLSQWRNLLRYLDTFFPKTQHDDSLPLTRSPVMQSVDASKNNTQGLCALGNIALMSLEGQSDMDVMNTVLLNYYSLCKEDFDRAVARAKGKEGEVDNLDEEKNVEEKLSEHDVAAIAFILSQQLFVFMEPEVEKKVEKLSNRKQLICVPASFRKQLRDYMSCEARNDLDRISSVASSLNLGSELEKGEN